MVTTIVMYIACRHAKLKLLLTSIVLQQTREADVITKQEHISMMHDIECTCKMQWYTIPKLNLVILGIMIFIITNARKLIRGHLFSNAVKVMLFLSDAQYYVPVKFCRTVGSIHLFKITGKLIPEHVTLKERYCGCYQDRSERSQYDFEWE